MVIFHSKLLVITRGYPVFSPPFPAMAAECQGLATFFASMGQAEGWGMAQAAEWYYSNGGNTEPDQALGNGVYTTCLV